MKVTYLANSGFLLETDAAYFMFDYYIGKIPELNKEKPLLIFFQPQTSGSLQSGDLEAQKTISEGAVYFIKGY